MSVQPSLRPDRDWHKWIATLIAIGAVLYSAGGKLMEIGAEKSDYERLKQIGEKQVQDSGRLDNFDYRLRDLKGAQERGDKAQEDGFRDVRSDIKSMRETLMRRR